jgi:2-polyprenyl-3-methyl-5-hydroxy-6-metoxy-1,4-benzoquinol methylase
LYPRTILSASNIDADAYWREKRDEKLLSDLSKWQKWRADFVLAELKGQEGVSFVDVGGGGGSIAKYLIEHIPGSSAVVADASEHALSGARANGLETILIKNLGNAEERKKIEDADYMLALEVLEHIPNAEEVLLDLMGKARRGVFFSFPNSGFFVHRFRLLFGKFPLQWKVHPGEHVRFWTARDLTWWLSALGLRGARVYFYGGIPLLNAMIPSWCAAGMLVALPKTS